MPNGRFILPLSLLATALVCLTAFRAHAQIPCVQWYFDADLTQTDRDCDGSFAQLGYVTAVNFNVWFSAVEYMVSYPPQIFWMADIPVNENSSCIGSTPVGIACAWKIPMNGFSPVVIMKVQYDWRCPNCNRPRDGSQPVIVGPHPTGRLSYITFALERFDAIGMVSMVCKFKPPVPVEETSWGKVKALYDN